MWFQNQAISALHTLQESLTETVMRHIFGRIEESPGNPDILLNMALKCAEEAVACFDNSSGQAVGMLIQVETLMTLFYYKYYPVFIIVNRFGSNLQQGKM